MSTTKYYAWNAGENQVAAAANLQNSMIGSTATEDMTVLMAFVDVAISSEPIDSDGSTNMAGLVRLYINPRGENPPTLTRSPDLFNTSDDSDLNDQDTGDTWAMATWALNSSGPGTGRSGTVMKVTLAPKTKRRLRKGDQLYVDIYGTNSGQNQAVIGWSCCVTIVTGPQ